MDKGELSRCEWETESRTVDYSSKLKLNLDYYSAKLNDEKEFTLAEENLSEKVHFPAAMDDIGSRNNDFIPRSPHPVVLWYGLRTFIIISANSSIHSENDMTTLLR